MQGIQNRTARIRGVLIAAAAVVVVAIVAAVLIFSGQDDSAAAPQAGGTLASSQQQQGERPDPGRPPGTVALPTGGTAKLVPEQVGDDGALVIPQSLGEAAWWGSGVGAAQGVTLLSGHVNWKGKTGPFMQLWQVKQGQTVTVTDRAGAHWGYRIDEVRTVHKSALATESAKLFSPEGPHRLVLVTCGGDYVGGTEGYDDNRVVTASLVSHP
ncbi:class F sortase [Amycolatopsis ultiminotia]|uniref:Class F sortase n=1 Tax=Amycolatopsis ultiminotia TaxID=543629 RepID=A0ABP6X386_9PSEU